MPNGNKIPFDYLGAKKAGYSDGEIMTFLKDKYAFDFDLVGAKKSGYSDTEIADYITKYEPVKKKEDSPFTSDPNAYLKLFGGTSSPTQLKLSKEKSQPIGKIEQTFATFDPYKQHRDEQEEIDKKSVELFSSINPNDPDPLKTIKNTPAKNNVEHIAKQNAIDHITKMAVPDGFEAKQILSDPNIVGDQSNETKKQIANYALEKERKYDDVVSGLREVEGMYSKQKFYQAAIKAYANENKVFAKELKTLGLDLNDPFIADKIDGVKVGHAVERFLQQPEVATYVEKENPNILPVAKDVEENLLTDNPKYGINKVANEVSQARIRAMKTNPLFDWTESDADYEATNKIAEDLYKDNPQKLAIYNQNIRDKQSDYLDKPSLTAGVARGIKDTFKGMAEWAKQPFTAKDEVIRQKWDDEAKNVSANPEGFLAVASDTGKMLGLIGTMGATGNVLGLAESPVANTVLTFGGEAIKHGREKYPDSPVKAGLSAIAETSLYAALSKNIFPTKNINQALQKVRPEIGKVIEKLSDGEISKEIARQEMQTAYGKAFDFVKGSVGKATKITGELEGIKLAIRGLDKAMMDDATFKEYHPDEEFDPVHTFLTNVAIGGLAKYGEAKAKDKEFTETIYNAASNPKQAQRLIDNASVDLSYGTVQEFKSNLNHAAKVKEQLDKEGFSEKAQKFFITQSLREKVAKEKAEQLTDPTLIKKEKDIAKEAAEVKEQILQGKDPEEIVTESQQKKIDEEEKRKTDRQRLQEDFELENKKLNEQRNSITQEIDNTDGRKTENKDKLKDLKSKLEEHDLKIKRAKEDFEKAQAKLQPKEEPEQKSVPEGGGEVKELLSDESLKEVEGLPEGYGKVGISKDKSGDYYSFFEVDSGGTKTSGNLGGPYDTYAEARADGERLMRRKYLKQNPQAQLPEPEIKTTNEQETIPKGDTENKQSQQQAEKEGQPSEPIIEPPQETAAGEGENKKIGVHHAALTDLAKELGLPEPERGEYISPEEHRERGRKMLNSGASESEIDNVNNELHDRISLGAAYQEKHYKELNEIRKAKGEGSKEYQDKKNQLASLDDKLKKLGTKAGQAMTSLQGERDIDTDNFEVVRKNFEEENGKAPSKAQEKKIQELTDTNEKLKKRADEAEAKLIEETEKAFKAGEEAGKKKSKGEKAKTIADKLRENAKLHKPNSFSAATPASLVWDAAVEIVAKGIEAGGKIADVIEKGLEHIRSTDWYKSLKDDKKETAERDFKEFHFDNAGSHSLEDLQARFVDKTGKFTQGEAKAIWDYAKETYLDKGVPFREMIANVSNDLGLNWKQVSDAITTPKTKRISDEMWKKQSDYRRNQAATKNWVENQGRNYVLRALRKISGAFRGTAVFGHGAIFVGTHSGMTMFDIPKAKYTIQALKEGYKFAYGNKGDYERSMEQLKNRPLYNMFQRAGLKNNPDIINAEEYQKSQHFISYIVGKKVGEKISTAGERGFNAIKVLRQNLAEWEYNHLTPEEKADPNAVRPIMWLVNNATGATNLKLPEAINEISFAGGMEAARWGKWTRNPARAASIALKALTNKKDVSVEERVFAKVWARRVGTQLATMAGMIAVNAAIQSLIDKKNPVNFTNPNKPDFLKFKFGDVTVDPTSGMRGTGSFIYGLGRIPFESKKELHGDEPIKAAGKQGAGYLRGKLSPFYSTAIDFYTKHDFKGNPLFTTDEKPTIGHHKVSWKEYLTQKLPLPMAEAATEMYNSALNNGASKVSLHHAIDGIISGGLSGATGFRVGEYDAEESNHSPFTEEDKKDPTFKYFLDKGMELPNTALSSEKVKDKTIAEYPKEKQDEYQKAHKEYLKSELKDIIGWGKVYLNSEDKVSLAPPDEVEYTTKKLDDLKEEELAQVLRIAQSNATKDAKEEVFYGKKTVVEKAKEDAKKSSDKERIMYDIYKTTKIKQ